MDTPVRADAKVSRGEDGRLHLALVVRAGNLVGTRNVDGRSCEDLAGATAVSLALLLQSPTPLREEDLVGREESSLAGGASVDGRSETARDTDKASSESKSATDDRSQKERDPEGAIETSRDSSPSTSESARATSSARDDESRLPRRWHALIQAPLVAVELAALPEPSLGVAAAAGVSFDRWRFLVDGSIWRTQRMTASDDPGISADVGLIAVGGRTCWAALHGRVDVGPCVTLTVEHLRARGGGDHIAPRTAESIWFAAGIGAEARWRLAPWFALDARVGAELETSRPRIAIDGVGTLGQVGPASVTVMLGPEWIL